MEQSLGQAQAGRLALFSCQSETLQIDAEAAWRERLFPASRGKSSHHLCSIALGVGGAGGLLRPWLAGFLTLSWGQEGSGTPI